MVDAHIEDHWLGNMFQNAGYSNSAGSLKGKCWVDSHQAAKEHGANTPDGALWELHSRDVDERSHGIQ